MGLIGRAYRLLHIILANTDSYEYCRRDTKFKHKWLISRVTNIRL